MSRAITRLQQIADAARAKGDRAAWVPLDVIDAAWREAREERRRKKHWQRIAERRGIVIDRIATMLRHEDFRTAAADIVEAAIPTQEDT